MSNKIKVKVENLNLYYGENHALKDVNMDIQENAVTAFIGPSRSTLPSILTPSTKSFME